MPDRICAVPTAPRPPRSARRRRVALLAAAVLGLSPTVLTLAPAATAAPAAVTDPAAHVDPTIGTSGYVDDFPGADVPFGMVQWSPDTPSRPAGGGYEYTDDATTGFSLTHISGPGCAAGGDVPLLPVSGDVPAKPDDATLPLDHGKERAEAGDYTLDAGGVSTRLTTTQRAGLGAFTFAKDQPATLLLKLSGSAAGTDATHFQVVNQHEVAGWVTSGHFCGADDTYTVYFDLTFDHDFTGTGTWQGADVAKGKRSLTTHTRAASRAHATDGSHRTANGERRTSPELHGKAAPAKVTPQASPPVADVNGAYLGFDTAENPTVKAKVGISYVSTANAKKNRTTEIPGWDVDAVATAAHDAWNDTLSKITISGGTADEQRVFYTALYHALLHPNVYSDVNRQYLGFDGEVHKTAKGHVEYANFSGWDIYRSQAQLEAMLEPQAASDEVRSMLDQYDQTGQLPKWELYNGESYVMVGDPADAIIADAYAFGARDFDTAHALDVMLTEANQPNKIRPGLSQYLDKGYLPLDGSYGCCNFYGPVSTQQEYDTADSAISSFAKALGDSDTATTFARRANNWQNVFNPATNFLQPKLANGQFNGNFNPSSSLGFVEGNSYQYTPMSPHDVKGLIAAAGGNDAWIEKLDGLTSTIKDIDSSNADFGNEPSIEIPWEYDYAGAPWKTQQTVRAIQQQIFPAKPAGIAGNDDLGTMSAWYVFSALGFYPETPGTADLAVGSPVFPKAVVTLASGKKLTITGAGATADAPYVHGLTLGGTAWNHAYLSPDLVQTGGKLAFTLGTTPDKGWASAAADAPPSDTTGLLPALGYVTDPQLVVEPGKTVRLTLGARAVGKGAQDVSWKAIAGDGPAASPSSGTVHVKPGKDATQTVTLTAPSADGRYPVAFSMAGAGGVELPKVVAEIDVAKPGELWPYYDNAGVSNDGATNQGDYDGGGWSYSAQALAEDGVAPGKSVTADGLTYALPAVAAGEYDNIVAGGQQIALATPTAGSSFGILGSATNASPGSRGTFVLHFTDGTTQSVTLGLSDWTLGGDGTTAPSYGNTVVSSMPYRDTASGGRQVIATYLFAAHADIAAGKTVQSVTFPAEVDSGDLHVFAFSVG
ncbi:alpha-1,2-mannosidase, putative [Jatrophihabitans endophyticus]|uniref:Alpha-1,2-mannosidase, putative n=1 Tax=Jatrophihabitans endophyticus TaxID=1206085 RepID=A0A1M5LN79_9ACTN|nr:lectin [Jatrophihabitans endophyticus]SHG66109.1 alpha-1,2-mannosidase, putative [Jatrophihabitans endophyticus]